MTAIRLLLAALLSTTGFAYATPSQGLPSNLHPKSYCNVLANAGYAARPYNAKTGGCSTPMLPLGKAQGKNGEPNNLAFYSMGLMSDYSKLDRVSLILNVNAEKEGQAAHAELTRATAALTLALTGADVPLVQKAVMEGKNVVAKAGAWSIEVQTSKWKTGHGHDVAVRFKPA